MAPPPVQTKSLPGSGARFQGILPPIVGRPVFTIRKKALKVFTIEDYVSQGVMTAEQARIIREAVMARQNILISGGTGSGKTTLANAILALIAETKDRVVILEDTQELQCQAEDVVALRTKDGTCSMRDLLKATMRLRPDRIVIGEVRGPEALDLLKAWNTGHPGGCATVHADSAEKALSRLQQLVQEAGINASRLLIEDTIDVVLYIEKNSTKRRVSQLFAIRKIRPTPKYHSGKP